MSNYLMIENKGELDTTSLILLGASTKRNDSTKIGFFGSGNKYALATLIRKEVPFKVFSGGREIDISTEDVNFRDVKFKKILIDGQATSLTTDMGPQWEEWMAVREWVSNSFDEGGSVIGRNESECTGKEGCTRFFIQKTPVIQGIVENWETLFTNERTDALFVNSGFKMFPHNNGKNHLVLYRKGIRAFERDTPSLYQYDYDGFEINESRIVDNIYLASSQIAGKIAGVTNKSVIRNLFKHCNTKSNVWESNLDWRWGVRKLSNEWLEVANERPIIVDTMAEFFEHLTKKPCWVVSASFAMMLLDKLGSDNITVHGLNEKGEAFAYKPTETTARMESLLNDCLEFLKKCDYSVDYPIEIVKFDNGEILGRAYKETILISDRVFTLGRREITSTIIEENEHLKSGYNDFTRAFQNHIFNLFLTEKEERFGVYL